MTKNNKRSYKSPLRFPAAPANPLLFIVRPLHYVGFACRLRAGPMDGNLPYSHVGDWYLEELLLDIQRPALCL